MKIVSIIVPIYNSVKFIDKLIESLLNQTFLDFEVIFVDDCSSDNSELYIKGKLYDKSIDYKYIYLSENKGPGNARNIALEIVAGQYILFIDSDDWISSDTLEILINQVESFPRKRIDLLIFDYFRAWADGKFKPYKEINWDTDNLSVDLYASLTNDGVTRKLFRSKIITENKILFPEWYNGEDIAFVIKYLAFSDTISYCNKNLYYYLQRAESTSNFNIRDDEFFIKIWELYDENFHTSEYRDNRIIQDLFYNQVLTFLKLGKSGQDLRLYLKKIKNLNKVSMKREQLDYFNLIKKIFIYAAYHEWVMILKCMWLVKKNTR